MANQTGPAVLTMPAAPRPASQGGNDWLISPIADIFFLANIAWLVALVPGFAAADGSTPVSFWQIYFLTVPHRWMTLGLVAFDPDRREGRGRLFLGMAVAAFVVVAGLRLISSAFLCLVLLDFVWNAWHFASQHAGVLRLYARKSSAAPGNPWLERNGMRLFIMYVLLRTVDWSIGWLEEIPGGTSFLTWLDMAMLLVPVLLLLRELRLPAAPDAEAQASDVAGTEGAAPAPPLSARPGKRIFLLSVCSLYSLLLMSVSFGWGGMVLGLAFASAWFHAAEYLAVVTVYAGRRQNQGSAGLARRLARNWLWLLAGFMVLLGIIAVISDKNWRGFWLGLNLWASLLHYAYDGMIWKLRRPATAQAFGVTGGLNTAAGN